MRALRANAGLLPFQAGSSRLLSLRNVSVVNNCVLLNSRGPGLAIRVQLLLGLFSMGSVTRSVEFISSSVYVRQSELQVRAPSACRLSASVAVMAPAVSTVVTVAGQGDGEVRARSHCALAACPSADAHVHLLRQDQHVASRCAQGPCRQAEGGGLLTPGVGRSHRHRLRLSAVAGACPCPASRVQYGGGTSARPTRSWRSTWCPRGRAPTR